MVKILFISFHFPPQGGAGVQRALKFAKYLPDFGIKPIVMTTATAPASKWTPKDDTLLGELEEQISVIRIKWPDYENTNTLEACVNELVEICTRHAIQAILVTMSPFQDAQLASALATRTNLPWIADLRDPWAFDEFQVVRSRWHRHNEQNKMKSALASSSHIVMNTPEASKRFREAFSNRKAPPISSITNGYDASDFQVHPPKRRNESFTIVHTGFLHTAAGFRQQQRRFIYAFLGSCDIGVKLLPRSHYYLLKALEKWLSNDPSAKANTQLILAGSLNATDQKVIELSSISDIVSANGYLSHTNSIKLIQNADLLFLPMHKLGPNKRASIVPGKTYEYLATGVPVLAAVPDGDAKDFIKNSGNHFTCEPDDVEAMADTLKERYAQWKSNQGKPHMNHNYVSRFERRNLTQKLASLIKSTIDATNS